MTSETAIGAVAVGSGLASIAAALFTRRAVVARRYVPKLFDANHIPPKFSLTRDAMHAIGDATLLATSAFTFAAASTWWIMGVTSLEEFGTRMKQKLEPLGPKLAASPAETKEDSDAINSIEQWLGGKK